jgi:hypothetical protein
MAALVPARSLLLVADKRRVARVTSAKEAEIKDVKNAETKPLTS